MEQADSTVPPLVYLSRAQVSKYLPSVEDQVEIVRTVYRAQANGEVELPPKPGIHPRPNAFIHAMPAYLSAIDVAALKWVSGYPSNQAQGLPYISGLTVVNDAATGLPTAVMDAGLITAARTAAVSGYCIQNWAPSDWSRVALLGCGEQGRFHADVVRALRGDVTIAAYDPDESRYATLGEGIEVAGQPEQTVAEADVVITAGPIVEDPQPILGLDRFPAECLVLPIDFDCYVQRDVAENANLFLVDDKDQFDYYRGVGHFASWPAPAQTNGEAELAGIDGELVISVNLGVGSLDAAFAAQVLDRARTEGDAVELAR